MKTTLEKLIQDLCLPDSYLNYIPHFFMPLAEKIKQQTFNNYIPIIGINGSQGSGKSTASRVLQEILKEKFELDVVILSIDDFYHTKAAREEIAAKVHPLFATRGVPGTHDIQLLNSTLCKLQQGMSGCQVKIPRFDKSKDDRHLITNWEQLLKPVNVILLEGWCVGIPPMPIEYLEHGINQLEKEEDNNAIWRLKVNEYLENDYQSVFSKIDWLLMLQAPGFDVVFEWRQLQEQKLQDKLLAQGSNIHSLQIMDDKQLSRFIQFYQRLTEHALKVMPDIANARILLDNHHHMTKLIFNE
ncbi:MAG: hypothetical protein HQL46_08765 [Gammaproteobacteria bacterium]|nr:hypothetical protein [Gammaproteobacteria bacterium]